MTILAQLRKHFCAKNNESVSLVLYIGQLCASLGLAYYSYDGEQWLFVGLNIAMALCAVAGISMWLVFWRRDDDTKDERTRTAAPQVARSSAR